MRTDDDTQTISPEHEAIVQACYNRALAGENLGGDELTDLTDVQTYARQIDDENAVYVDIAKDGRFDAWIEMA